MVTLWFMGLPASGKSTIASRVEDELTEAGFPIENLDGDELRKNLHPNLGFSREERRINNRRTAYVANLLNRNNIATIVAMITPFREAQHQAREVIEPENDFVLIYVKCPLEVCERRDPKGMYAKAREGNIENFTGISHPFQEPADPDIVVDTNELTVEETVDDVLQGLKELGVLEAQLEDTYDFDITRREEQDIEERLRRFGHLEEDQ